MGRRFKYDSSEAGISSAKNPATRRLAGYSATGGKFPPVACSQLADDAIAAAAARRGPPLCGWKCGRSAPPARPSRLHAARALRHVQLFIDLLSDDFCIVLLAAVEPAAQLRQTQAGDVEALLHQLVELDKARRFADRRFGGRPDAALGGLAGQHAAASGGASIPMHGVRHGRTRREPWSGTRGKRWFRGDDGSERAWRTSLAVAEKGVASTHRRPDGGPCPNGTTPAADTTRERSIQERSIKSSCAGRRLGAKWRPYRPASRRREIRLGARARPLFYTRRREADKSIFPRHAAGTLRGSSLLDVERLARRSDRAQPTTWSASCARRWRKRMGVRAHSLAGIGGRILLVGVGRGGGIVLGAGRDPVAALSDFIGLGLRRPVPAAICRP